MSDLVEKLRTVAEDYDFHDNALVYEAADEIERLRAGGCARNQRTTQWCAEAVDANARAQRAEAQNAALREAASTYDAAMQAIGGCGDGGCVVVKPVGQHTNGGCRCMRDQIKSQRVARAANALRAALATGGDE